MTELALEEESPPPAATPANGASQPDAAPSPPREDGLRESQALRIDMLNSLKPAAPEPAPEIVEISTESNVPSPPKPRAPQPDSIENQINTSMTQTLEALNVASMADSVANETAEEKPRKSGGLFARFRKSS